MRFKIKVVENIGAWSHSIFGNAGTVHEIEDETFLDRVGDEWDNDSRRGYQSIEEVNRHIYSIADEFQTRFELVKDVVELNKSILSHGQIVRTVEGRLYRYENRNNFGMETRAFYLINGSSFVMLTDYNNRLENINDDSKTIMKIYTPLETLLERTMLADLEQLVREAGISNYTEQDIRERLSVITGSKIH